MGATGLPGVPEPGLGPSPYPVTTMPPIDVNERIATLGIPSWVVGVVLPVSALLSVFGLFQSVRTRRAVLAADESA